MVGRFARFESFETEFGSFIDGFISLTGLAVCVVGFLGATFEVFDLSALIQMPLNFSTKVAHVFWNDFTLASCMSAVIFHCSRTKSWIHIARLSPQRFGWCSMLLLNLIVNTYWTRNIRIAYQSTFWLRYWLPVLDNLEKPTINTFSDRRPKSDVQDSNIVVAIARIGRWLFDFYVDSLSHKTWRNHRSDVDIPCWSLCSWPPDRSLLAVHDWFVDKKSPKLILCMNWARILL